MPGDTKPWVATYRLQLNRQLGFSDVKALLPYLKKLGISHLYLSPILEAADGSEHGYDVVDHERISSALGGEAAFVELHQAAREAGLGMLIDVVPNHMSTGDTKNRWWWDVLENGPAGRSAHVFDIDWDPPDTANSNLVVLPVLGDHRWRVLERRELKLNRSAATFWFEYFEHKAPVAPRSLGSVLRAALRRSGSTRLGFIADGLSELPLASDRKFESVERRNRDRRVLLELLAELVNDEPEVAKAIDAELAGLNADPARLDALLDAQNHRLIYWKTGHRELDYRRFFDQSHLVGLRMEDQRVFEATHAIYQRLHSNLGIDGFRVDHVDGLSNPRVYLERLRAMAPGARVYVEKILAAEEQLPAWPVAGTTGYEFAVSLNQLSFWPEASANLTTLHTTLTGETRPFEQIGIEARRDVSGSLLAAELERLTQRLAQLRAHHREARDFGRHELAEALTTLLAIFPRYRTYIEPERGELDPVDVNVLEGAFAAAKAEAPSIDGSVFDFLSEVLTLKRRGEAESDFVRRFQQLSAPVMAKGLEDTAFYRYPRMLAMNEVGGEPSVLTLAVEGFHLQNLKAQRDWPHRMLASTTHDTKRSEDVRARLVALSHCFERYEKFAHWFFEQAPELGPEPSMRMTALQTLIGAWPLSLERAVAVLQKSAREAKQRSNWSAPNADYERQLETYVRRLFDPDIQAEVGRFVKELDPLARRIALGWALLKCTCPGMPDFYQGHERWKFDLVDPDNRRPVDWSTLRQALEAPERRAVNSDDEGLTKLHVIRKALALRAAYPDVFGAESRYEPLEVRGPKASHVVAFTRTDPQGTQVTVVASRWPATAWGDTSVSVSDPRGAMNVLTDERFEGRTLLAKLFAELPVALLVSTARQ